MNWKQKVEDLRFNQNLSWSQIAERLQGQFPNLTYQQVYDKVRTYIRRTKKYKEQNITEDVDIDNKKSFEMKSDGTFVSDRLIAICENQDMTPEFILKAHGLDVDKWEVVSYKNNLWHSQVKGGKQLVMYQSKVVVRPKAKTELSLEEVQKHFERFQKTYKPTTPIINQKPNKKMFEVNIADLHLGKLAWNRETGENYDYKIAKKRFFEIIDAEVERAKTGNFEFILFAWCNDFFNSDGISNTTTAGTAQDYDVRWQKLFLVGCEMLVEAIDKLSQYAPVETFYIASNHSRQTEFYAINYLYAWYKDNDRVQIDLNCRARYYKLYGNCLIGFSHSYYEKKVNLPQLMSVEVPEYWAKAKYREYHLAHYHSEQVKEMSGIIFRWLPSVTGTDAYHYDCGYVGSVKRSYSFVWNKETGLETINCVCVTM